MWITVPIALSRRDLRVLMIWSRRLHRVMPWQSKPRVTQHGLIQPSTPARGASFADRCALPAMACVCSQGPFQTSLSLRQAGCLTHRWRVADGTIAPEFIAAALDCPGFQSMQTGLKPYLLGEYTCRIDRPVHVDEACVIVGWKIEVKGRRHIVGTSLYNQDGALLRRRQGRLDRAAGSRQRLSFAGAANGDRLECGLPRRACSTAVSAGDS